MVFEICLSYNFASIGKLMSNDIENQKAKIRERYKGKLLDDVEIIPALPQPKLYDDNRVKRVAAYARVSTIDINQTTSYELQKNHYTDLIQKHEGWVFVDIYADEGISGTSLNHRDAFVRMIEDCKQGKIDLIVTKSVSRFARNTLDCLEYVRELKNLPNPVGIFFETENIYTLDSRSEMALSFIATMAQEESHIKSDIMNASIEMRFSRGILLTPVLLGYDKDENGRLVINEVEAKTVKLIFFLYLYGNSCQKIANILTEYGRKTKKGNTKWTAGTVLQVLQNERHCGDVLTRKTWTPNYLDHKSKKNRQNLEQRRWKNQHDAIISRADFMAVQELIRNAKYGNKGFLPELRVVDGGILKGYVSVNPRWAAFLAKDYIEASSSILDIQENKNEEVKIEVQGGDFDLRKYQVARSQFFDRSNIVSMTFSINNIIFSTECIKKMPKNQFVEMLINPCKKMFAVRQCKKDECRNAVQWSKRKGDLFLTRVISGAAFIPTIYEIMNWNVNHKYRLRGEVHTNGNEVLITFNMTETEIFISNDHGKHKLPERMKPFTNGPKKDIMAFPSDWASTFGNSYYRQAQAKELAMLSAKKDLKISEEGIAYNSSDINDVTSQEELCENIQNIKNEMQQEILNDAEQ